jgi:hypothetical protein
VQLGNKNNLLVGRVLLVESNGTRAWHSNLSNQIPSGLTLSVATLALNEGMYLREWIEFHLLVGVELFIIFDDGSADNTTSVVIPYIISHRVILIDAKESFYQCAHRDPHRTEHLQADCQRATFNYARLQLSGKTTWMGNFDVDEFFYTPEKAFSLRHTLKHAYWEYDRIRVVGMVFGGNNHSLPTDQPVIKSYTSCAAMDLTLDLDGFRFGRKELYRPERVIGSDIHASICWTCSTAVIKPLASDIRMNHYQYKSRSEQQKKVLINGNAELDINSYRDTVLNEVEEFGIQYLLPSLLLKLRKNDS